VRILSTDRDPGDLDPAEAHQVVDAWHPSHLPAILQRQAGGPTPTGKHFSAQLLETVKAAEVAKTAAKPSIPKTSWADTPDAFKRLVARSAGLGVDVVSKNDRDLTEFEKNCIRAAAGRLKARADALFAL
jgi:alpha-ketoglutarate-dependent taurine dioxygenase